MAPILLAPLLFTDKGLALQVQITRDQWISVEGNLEQKVKIEDTYEHNIRI